MSATATGAEPAVLGRAAYFVPRPPGSYVLVEGSNQDDDGWEARWCRIVSKTDKVYERRPAIPIDDPVDAILKRVSFAGQKEEARALESALELIELGRADLALELSEKASPDRAALATWTRVMALAAQRDSRVSVEALALAQAWLRPATSATSPNQALPRGHVLRALDAVLAIGADVKLTAIRTEVELAPEPDVYMDHGDAF
jgi:hypothetical protein